MPRPRDTTDRGSTSLTTVLLTPVFVVIALMAFQAALWTHARTEARVIARNGAAMVARSHAEPSDAERSAAEVLARDTDLSDPRVSITVESGLVTVRVWGDAPGMIRGTSARVEVTEAVPMEGFR